MGVGGALVGLVLSVSGYEANVETQTEGAIGGIYALMTWIPAISYLLTFATTHYLYKLNRENMQMINKALFVKA